MTHDPTRRRFLSGAGALGASLLAGCIGAPAGGDDRSTDAMTEGGMTDAMTDDGMGAMTPLDPTSAPRVAVDRFSEAAGTLQVRTDENGLPGPDEPVDFYAAPFVTRGLGPDGGVVEYYNFDVQPTQPAPIYVLVREGEDAPVEGQLNVIDVVPGDEGYSDFWHPHLVTVPADYEANAITSVRAIEAGGYTVAEADVLVNCPVVPDGSTAEKRAGDGASGLVEGWYRDRVVSYFEFVEAPLAPRDGAVPLSPIYVAFNANPGEDGGGPPSGFRSEADGIQTHNVVATLPGDDGYSPLWLVNVYDTADFGSVSDLASAVDADQVAAGVATVNCPIVTLP